MKFLCRAAFYAFNLIVARCHTSSYHAATHKTSEIEALGAAWMYVEIVHPSTAVSQSARVSPTLLLLLPKDSSYFRL